MVTIGVSPKVKVPSIVIGVIGVVLVAASYIVEGLEPVRDVGAGMIAASPLAGYLGYKAPPGAVALVGPASDGLVGSVEPPRD